MSTDVPFLDLARETAAVRAELDAAVSRVFDRGWFLIGPELEAFETAFASYAGAAHAVGVASGLAAIELILQARDIGPGDEVIVPANTCMPTWVAVSNRGATPVPVEPDPVTRNIDPERVPAAITERTRAVLAVHLYGLPADLPALREVTTAHGLELFVDAAQSAGAELSGTRAATLGDATAFSFYPTKNLGAPADAGAVVTDKPEIADRVQRLRNYGMRSQTDHPEIGTNARMDEISAAALLAKLPKLDTWNARREEIAARYIAELAELPLVLPPMPDPSSARSSWHLFVVGSDSREALRDHLARCGIGSAIHYATPPHLTAAYAGTAEEFGALPITERLADRALSLPASPFHHDHEIGATIDALRGFFS